ncbi:hypothetical protein OS493_027251 [Desmophyllum pertusum]|uniref:Uncharacterized protein n=1 Tax=Desmophyllum pertusum TaxID=174260 RepID=A0A9W9ZB14_9CNID|nr:hypothetical protein OS493_027251 [Desmophyllum pertusum]
MKLSDMKTTPGTASKQSPKLENIRTYFGKEDGKECEVKPKSGSGAVEAFKSAWPWYKSLKWLKDHISQKESITNLVDLDPDSDSSNSSVASAINPKKGKKIKVSAEEKIVQAAEAIVANFQHCPVELETPQEGQITDDELYG